MGLARSEAWRRDAMCGRWDVIMGRARRAGGYLYMVDYK